MKSITPRQLEVLTFINEFSEQNSYSPTVREISAHFGISLRAVQDHLVALQKKGFLMHTPGKTRTLKINVSNPLDMVIRKKSPLMSEIKSFKRDAALLVSDNESALSFIMKNQVTKAQFRDYLMAVNDINSCYDGQTIALEMRDFSTLIDVFDYSNVNGEILGLKADVTEREKKLYVFARDCELTQKSLKYPDIDSLFEEEFYEYFLLPEEEECFISYENQIQKFLNQDFSEMI